MFGLWVVGISRWRSRAPNPGSSHLGFAQIFLCLVICVSSNHLYRAYFLWMDYESAAYEQMTEEKEVGEEVKEEQMAEEEVEARNPGSAHH